MREQSKSRAFLALGGNLADPLSSFRDAWRAFAQHSGIVPIAASSLYQTPPIGGPADQPDYLNAVIELVTSIPAQELLDFCRQIENAAGRTREVHWGARTLDLDLIFYDQVVLNEPELILPHPRMHERHFVLLPLAELAEDFQHPIFKKSIAELLAALPAPEGIHRLKKRWLNND